MRDTWVNKNDDEIQEVYKNKCVIEITNNQANEIIKTMSNTQISRFKIISKMRHCTTKENRIDIFNLYKYEELIIKRWSAK